jgi:MoxR-like ATPase
MKYALVTFGCRVNQADSLAIEGDLRARGGIAVPPEEAEFVVVNTCTVTASADQAARQTIRRIARGNPKAQVVVTGCYATREPEKHRLASHKHLIAYGASPRATIFLAQAAKAHAFINGRGYVTPEDVKTIGADVLRHRVLVSYEAEAEGIDSDKIVKAVFEAVEVP